MFSDANNRSSVLSNIPHKILNLQNKGTNRRQKEALRNFMARYGRYEQSPVQIETERIAPNQSPISSKVSPPISLKDDASHHSIEDEEKLKEIILSFGNDQLEVLLRQVAETIKDRIHESKVKT